MIKIILAFLLFSLNLESKTPMLCSLEDIKVTQYKNKCKRFEGMPPHDCFYVKIGNHEGRIFHLEKSIMESSCKTIHINNPIMTKTYSRVDIICRNNKVVGVVLKNKDKKKECLFTQ